MAKRTMPPEWYASQAARRLHRKALEKTSSAPYIKQAKKERKDKLQAMKNLTSHSHIGQVFNQTIGKY